MATTLTIKVTEGRTVRNPLTGEKLKLGVTYTFDDSIFWRRRIQSGDVIEAAPKTNIQSGDKTEEETEEKGGSGRNANKTKKK